MIDVATYRFKSRRNTAVGISGRAKEQLLLKKVLDSGQPEFMALYGRRRVGKTHLVREFFAPRAGRYFEVTGERDAPRRVQLFHFKQALERTFGKPQPAFASWDLALSALADQVDREPEGVPVVLFFDELPWLATRRSRVVQALEYTWNTRWSRKPHVKLVVCGSAAGWMVDRVIQAKGGLHNRITRQLALQPFRLTEAMEYLRDRGVRMGLHQALQLYMAIGGVPYYLNQVEPAQSAAQVIGAVCFARDGILRTEFSRLFAALFGDPAYEQIVRKLAEKRHGLLRAELIADSPLTSGGGLHKRLSELEQAGFIARTTLYPHKTRNTAYRVVDPYVFFYLRWIERAPSGLMAGMADTWWLEQVGSPAYTAWSGFAFETLCLQHAQEVKAALGLGGIASNVGSWRWLPSKGMEERGAQVDLLFDRVDGIVTLCELKYLDHVFIISKAYARELRHKVLTFEAQAKTKKEVQLALISAHGLRPNIWSDGLVDVSVSAEDVFGSGRGV